MGIISAYVVPHPPIAVPEIGKDRISGMKTLDSFKTIAKDIAEKKPETIIIVSPHSVLYSDYIHISPGISAEGSLSQYGYSKKMKVEYDAELVYELESLCEEAGISAGTMGERAPELDHGTLVPLYFINQEYSDYMLVRISISGLSRLEHYHFGMLLSDAVDSLSRSAVIVASGDLSHKLSEDGPYGFAPEGPKLDNEICDALKSSNFSKLLSIEESLSEKGADCGLNSFIVMAGALDKKAVKTDFLSYEGPFGVGYALSIHSVEGSDLSRNFYEKATAGEVSRAAKAKESEDEYVSLARKSLEHYVRTGKRISQPDDLPRELTSGKAGVFVSIKKEGRLRGCIGTMEPTRESIAQEIIENAISAAARDPRFPPINALELEMLVISVDVLTMPVPADIASLDPERFGVIVTSGGRRGVLLPDLEGVDTVSQQLHIACQKAGIDPGEKYLIERFEVVRHT